MRSPGQLLGAGAADAVERMVWVVAEPGSERFGEIVEADVMGDDNRGLAFDPKGVAAIDGEEIFGQKVASSKAADFRTDPGSELGGARTSGDRLVDAGQQSLGLSEAAALTKDTDQPKYLSSSTRGMEKFRQHGRQGPAN